jgi:hypothetical protein
MGVLLPIAVWKAKGVFVWAFGGFSVEKAA